MEPFEYDVVHESYGEGERHKVDFFVPRGGGRKVEELCLLFIHGGGWSAGSKESWHPVAAYFAAKGYTAASIGYRLAPEYTFPAQIEDARLAMRYVQEQAGRFAYRADRIIAAGSSAGGHLSLMLGTIGVSDPLGDAADTRPYALVCYCPVTTMAMDREFIATFMGGPRDGREDAYREASPVERIGGGEPPLLMLQGDADETTPPELARELADRWRECGGQAELRMLFDVRHGFGYGTETPAQRQSLAWIENFIKKL